MRLGLKAREENIYIPSVYMLQATEQEKNLGSGEQYSETSKQCLKPYKKITKQEFIHKGLEQKQRRKKILSLK